MNTNPDETRLALWLDDELAGADLAEMEAWAAGHPEQIDAREGLRGYKRMMAGALPASEEPPYPDFFLGRVNQGIRDLELAKGTTPRSAPIPFWKSWLIPVAACAGMVLAFGIGRQTTDPSRPHAVTPAVSHVVYTPEDGVDAVRFASSDAGATVIVLQGVSAIPDSTDFSETVYVPTARESDRTAVRDREPSNSSQQ